MVTIQFQNFQQLELCFNVRKANSLLMKIHYYHYTTTTADFTGKSHFTLWEPRLSFRVRGRDAADKGPFLVDSHHDLSLSYYSCMWNWHQLHNSFDNHLKMLIAVQCASHSLKLEGKTGTQCYTATGVVRKARHSLYRGCAILKAHYLPEY